MNESEVSLLMLKVGSIFIIETWLKYMLNRYIFRSIYFNVFMIEVNYLLYEVTQSLRWFQTEYIISLDLRVTQFQYLSFVSTI